MSGTAVGPATGERLRAGDSRHAEVAEFLEDEASLLDHNRLLDWTRLMAPDVVYRMPVRVTRMRDDSASEFSAGMFHFDETAATLLVKVSRLATTASPWAENPPSRTRRFITNIKAYTTDVPEEIAATSSLLLTRSRYDDAHLDLITAERRDVLRRVAGGFQIARRTIYVDQSTLGLSNLAIFF